VLRRGDSHAHRNHLNVIPLSRGVRYEIRARQNSRRGALPHLQDVLQDKIEWNPLWSAGATKGGEAADDLTALARRGGAAVVVVPAGVVGMVAGGGAPQLLARPVHPPRRDGVELLGFAIAEVEAHGSRALADLLQAESEVPPVLGALIKVGHREHQTA